MIKKTYQFAIIFLFILISACSGYKPIFGTNELNFKISDYSLKGEKILGNSIYQKLNYLAETNKNKLNPKNLSILIDVSKNKITTAKDTSGKALEYKITLNAKIKINDAENGNEILNTTFMSSLSYKAQDLHSDTIRLENQTIKNLTDKTYQEILIKLSENIL
tara:strand:+ start:1772 stop:2260 length:489 start_codon:yes stop_codon:yes gene_type:complete